MTTEKTTRQSLQSASRSLTALGWKVLAIVALGVLAINSGTSPIASAHMGPTTSLGSNPFHSAFEKVNPASEETLFTVPDGQEFVMTNYKVTYAGPSGYSSCSSSKCDMKAAGTEITAYLGSSSSGKTTVLPAGATIRGDNNNSSGGVCSSANCLYYFDGYFVQE